MSNSRINLQGAVDLGAVKAQSATAATPRPATNTPVIIDVTTMQFEQQVIVASQTVPVIIDLWATWCGPCKQLSPILESLAVEYGGRFILAKVDVDAEQQIAAAFQVQSIPSVFVAMKGQVAPLFQGAIAEPQARQVIEAVLAEYEGAQEPQSKLISDPRFDAAEAAIEAGDWVAAENAYRELLKDSPNDPIAKIGLLNVGLMARTDNQDLEALATTSSSQLADQLLAADAQFMMNDISGAFTRLVELIRDREGDERVSARARLIEFFDILGPTDPQVIAGRTQLANALF